MTVTLTQNVAALKNKRDQRSRVVVRVPFTVAASFDCTQWPNYWLNYCTFVNGKLCTDWLSANKPKNLRVFLQLNRSFVSIAAQGPLFKMLSSGAELQHSKSINAASFKCKRTTRIGLVFSCVYSGVFRQQDRTRTHQRSSFKKGHI